MRFYRVHAYSDDGESMGYFFFTSKKAAQDYVRDMTDSGEIDIIYVTPTKIGIVNALNEYASHPDNG